jgi:hypothetical protein
MWHARCWRRPTTTGWPSQRGSRPRRRGRSPVLDFTSGRWSDWRGRRWVVDRKVWSAEELLALSPAERHEIFEASIITDLDQVPEEFLARVRERFQARLAGQDMPNAS